MRNNGESEENIKRKIKNFKYHESIKIRNVEILLKYCNDGRKYKDVLYENIIHERIKKWDDHEIFKLYVMLSRIDDIYEYIKTIKNKVFNFEIDVAIDSDNYNEDEILFISKNDLLKYTYEMESYMIIKLLKEKKATFDLDYEFDNIDLFDFDNATKIDVYNYKVYLLKNYGKSIMEKFDKNELAYIKRCSNIKFYIGTKAKAINTIEKAIKDLFKD